MSRSTLGGLFSKVMLSRKISTQHGMRCMRYDLSKILISQLVFGTNIYVFVNLFFWFVTVGFE